MDVLDAMDSDSAPSASGIVSAWRLKNIDTVSALTDSGQPGPKLLRLEALVVAYAMSRLNKRLLEHRGWSGWSEAFRQAGNALGVKATSMNNLRDEFDPFFDNGRKGWVNRPVRSSRQRVLGEFADVSDDALLHVIDGVLDRDEMVRTEIVRPLGRKTGTTNAAERLRTGRAAEALVIERCEAVLGMTRSDLVDRRDAACGFDFGHRAKPNLAIEVKGMKSSRGRILFTDLEWRMAHRLRSDYLVVVVGSVFENPVWQIVADPTTILDASVAVSRSITTSWSAPVEVKHAG